MSEVYAKLFVISDLHCHPKRESYDDDKTHLFSDKLRSPEKDHPVESLYEVISANSLESNLLLCPGDFTDQCSQQGLISGWQYVKEIANALNCKEIIATLGNHDVDSRNKNASYSFEIAKKIKQDFPLKNSEIGSFWDKGYTFVEKENVQILVLNTAHYHTHSSAGKENPTVKGKIDKGSIEEIDKYLHQFENESRIKILLCHHHPVQHSRGELGEHDFIENGDELIDILGKHKYDLVIHGHKHDPWLRYHRTSNGYEIPILASGSFSASGQADYIGKFNYFHYIEIKKDNGTVNAKMKTWEFVSKQGWQVNKSMKFYPYTGFGYTDSENNIADKIDQYLSAQNGTLTMWDNIVSHIPELEFLTPDKIDALEKILSSKKILTNPEIGFKPKHCYKDE